MACFLGVFRDHASASLDSSPVNDGGDERSRVGMTQRSKSVRLGLQRIDTPSCAPTSFQHHETTLPRCDWAAGGECQSSAHFRSPCASRTCSVLSSGQPHSLPAFHVLSSVQSLRCRCEAEEACRKSKKMDSQLQATVTPASVGKMSDREDVQDPQDSEQETKNDETPSVSDGSDIDEADIEEALRHLDVKDRKIIALMAELEEVL